ncbi:MAG: hypothetical protein IPL52_06485 [Flavobacteriales bacterium]|nr:hypothetical protein [Flavobacteriales bacterium]
MQQRKPLITPPNPDDNSTNGHRQALGWLGIALPLVLPPIAGSRPIDGAGQWWAQLNSISAYYHTGAEVFFIGIVMALGTFLITYLGYKNKKGSADFWVSTLAGLAAVTLAFFPTEADSPYASPVWWRCWMETVHLSAASTLFGSFAFMALFLFTFKKGLAVRERLKKPSNRVHILCGLVIVGCMAYVAVGKSDSIFWPEAIMLWAFGISWLTKGKVDETWDELKVRARRSVKRMFGSEGKTEVK